jgi:SAM-dependent methyltransferase
MTTSYDIIAYPTRAFPQTHPDRLACHAALFGLPYAPIGEARVLDIGCGDGGNIIPMAVAYPNARFVGFDLAAVAVERGRRMIEALGLTNIRLEALDLTTADLGAEAFDYIIAHGVYSWIPDVPREALMASIRHHMAPHGVAFVSYNALPGGRLRQMIRDMLLFHLRGIEEPHARVDEARRRLAQYVEMYAADTPFDQAVRSECQSLLDRPAGVIAHDELGEFYTPVHFHQFAEHAARHDLQFLTEAAPNRCGEGFRPPYALDDEAFDVLAHVQDLDFKALRMYRQGLLVRAETPLNRRPEPGRLRGLFAAAPVVKAEAENAYDCGSIRFELSDGPLQRAVERLGEAWPMAVPIADLIDDDERLGVMLRMYWVGALGLHTAPPPFSTTIAERPTASVLARMLAASGERQITTLSHGWVDIDDETGRRFIARLDGRRTVDEIARDMAAELCEPLDQVQGKLMHKLNELARMPLLV